jgi:dihydroorotate dehydrogenase (NAD+) catalytic subunit
MTVDQTIPIGSLLLPNPVLVASGTFGYGDESRELVDVNLLGGIVTKSISLRPRDGNPPPRIVETVSGMLNSIGLANVGVEAFISEKLPYLRTLKTTIIVNIAASSTEEYCAVLERLEREEGIHAYEINVSCPNVKEGGLQFGTSPAMTGEITNRLRRRTAKPLILKLTPNVTSIGELARAAAEHGADAVTVMNTVIGMAIDIHSRKPKLSTTTGGLSGPAVKPIALAKVYETSRAVSIPVIGIGGIVTTEDALEFLIAGASAVQIGTANFVDPSTGVRVAQGIADYCAQRRIASVRELVGSLQIREEHSLRHGW